MRHGLFAGKIARPPRSPLPLPTALKVTDDPAIEAVALIARYVASSVHRTLACPLASLVTEVALSAPLPLVALHVTVAPLTGAPDALLTVTTSGDASVDDSVPCCASPLVLAIVFADGGGGGGGGGAGALGGGLSPGVVGVAAAHATVAVTTNTSRANFGMRMGVATIWGAGRAARAGPRVYAIASPRTTKRSISRQPQKARCHRQRAPTRR